MKTIEACIYVEPTPKGRPRVTNIGGHAHAYTPAKTRKAEQNILALIRTELKKNFQAFEPGTPLAMSVTFYRERPKHLSKRFTEPVTRPDIINYASLVCDALQKYVYSDDSQIVNLHVRKKYGSPPRIELKITEVIE